MKNYIKGNYRKSIYKTDLGYVIGLFKVRDTNDDAMKDFINQTITFTGYFQELNEDDTYIFYGEEINHPKYGSQYKVDSYERIKPQDKDGIVEFLSSDLFSGVGEKLALKIVETLGENTLDLILQDSSNLLLVPKMTQKKALKIYNTLAKYEESHKTIVYLNELGFNMKDSMAIYNTYKSNTLLKIENNIYSIIYDIDGLSFNKIDEIALKRNVDIKDENRIIACILYIMKELTFKNSDTYLLKEEIKMSTIKYLNYDILDEDFNKYLENLILEDRVVAYNDFYYLKEMWDSEEEIVKKIIMLSNKKVKNVKVENYIEELEKVSGIKYNDNQKEAITKALENNILIITGGPGTGKTTIIKAITQIYAEVNKLDYDALVERLALLAPTGRASKRMSESTYLPATTIHRFLKWNQDNLKFGINEFNKDKSKLIIIDEVSMIDTNLLDSLFKGLTDDIKLILVGDYNQLPSVGPGQILKDLIESKMIDVVHLNTLYRQDEDSYIPVLASEIQNDNLSSNFLETKSDYTFLECSEEAIKQSLKNICNSIVKKGYDYKKVQLLAPMYAGINGIDNLNKELQNVFNPKSDDKKELVFGDVIFRENDKILQLVNMPEENVFNGDIGVIKNIIYKDQSMSGKNEIYVDFDGIIVKYLPKDFIKIKHGFIISIHKSQGSEFEVVVIPICRSYKRMMYKKLIYTGITRAKKKLILVGEKEVFVNSVHNNTEIPRKTSLKEKLIANLNKM